MHRIVITLIALMFQTSLIALAPRVEDPAASATAHHHEEPEEPETPEHAEAILPEELDLTALPAPLNGARIKKALAGIGVDYYSYCEEVKSYLVPGLDCGLPIETGKIRAYIHVFSREEEKEGGAHLLVMLGESHKTPHTADDETECEPGGYASKVVKGLRAVLNANVTPPKVLLELQVSSENLSSPTINPREKVDLKPEEPYCQSLIQRFVASASHSDIPTIYSPIEYGLDKQTIDEMSVILEQMTIGEILDAIKELPPTEVVAEAKRMQTAMIEEIESHSHDISPADRTRLHELANTLIPLAAKARAEGKSDPSKSIIFKIETDKKLAAQMPPRDTIMLHNIEGCLHDPQHSLCVALAGIEHAENLAKALGIY